MKLFQLMVILTTDLLVLGDIAVRNCHSCPTPHYQLWTAVGPYCARHFRNPLTFGEAEIKCRGEHPRGHLISIHDNMTMFDVQSITDNGSEQAWIGGLKIPCTNTYMWTDGSNWNYQNWVPGEPLVTGDCVQINWHTPGMFDNTECCSKRSYVCAFLPEQ